MNTNISILSTDLMTKAVIARTQLDNLYNSLVNDQISALKNSFFHRAWNWLSNCHISEAEYQKRGKAAVSWLHKEAIQWCKSRLKLLSEMAQYTDKLEVSPSDFQLLTDPWEVYSQKFDEFRKEEEDRALARQVVESNRHHHYPPNYWYVDSQPKKCKTKCCKKDCCDCKKKCPSKPKEEPQELHIMPVEENTITKEVIPTKAPERNEMKIQLEDSNV